MSILSTDILVSNQTDPLKTGGGLPSTAMAVPGLNATTAATNQLIIAPAGGVTAQTLLAGVAGTGSFSVGNVLLTAGANSARLYNISPATNEVFPYKTNPDGTIRPTARDYFVKLNVTSTSALTATATGGAFTATVTGPTSATAGSLLQISRATRTSASIALVGGTLQADASNPTNLTVTFIDRNLTMATPA
jgi:hypothetical protein